MKKSLSRILCAFLTAALMLSVACMGVAAAQPNISATSAVVLDTKTDAFYYEKNADFVREPASMTKLMTAYIVFEEISAGNLRFDSPLTVSAAAAAFSRDSEYSNVPLSAGEVFTVDEMLKVLLVQSACAAGDVLGEAISGSQAAFVQRMNEEALALGLTAQFHSSHGGFHDLSTARSIALLADHFIEKYPSVLNYTSLSSVTFKNKTYYNTNRLLTSMPYAGVEGLKTGTTSAGGNCLAVSATQSGRRIITVVMNSSTSTGRFNDSKLLLDYGFSRFAANDAAINSAVFEISGEKDEIRTGADFTANVTLLSSSGSIATTGTWLINGNVAAVERISEFMVGNSLSYRFDLRQYAGSDVTIGFSIKQPDGYVKLTEKTFSFSAEEPCAFRDVNGHWAENAIASLKNQGAISGYLDGNFQPDISISRSEFVTILIRYLQQQGKITVADEASGFGDTKGHWADQYIAAAAKSGIAYGYQDHTFAPNANISRQEIACFLARAFALQPDAENLKSFNDEKGIAPWAQESVQAAAANGLFVGYVDGSFRPANDALRSEVAMVIYKASLLSDDR